MARQKRLDLILGARDNASRKVRGLGSVLGGLKGKVLALGGAIGAALGARQIVRFASSSVSAFFEQEQATENLRTSLELAGDQGASSLDGLREFASGLQDVTTQGDEATLKLAAYIAQIGVLTGDKLKSATTATLGLARATQQGQEIMGRAYLNALEGNFQMLERYVPALRATTDQTEKMAIVQDLARRGLAQMQTDGNTSRGAVQQMKNSWGDFKELLGGGLAPAIVNVSKRFKVFLEGTGPRIAAVAGQMIGKVGQVVAFIGPKIASVFSFIRGVATQFVDFMMPWWIALADFYTTGIRTLLDVVSSAVGAVAGLLSPLMGSIGGVGNALVTVRDTAIHALRVIQFGFEHWRDVVELSVLGVGLGVVRFANQVTHFFTEAIPSVLLWLRDNWRSILTDIGNLTVSIFSNIAGNVVEFFKSIPALISGQKSFADIWTPLTTGFEATLSELPNIARRKEGQLEQVLREQVEGLQSSLGDGLGNFLEEKALEAENRRRAIRDFFSFGGGDNTKPDPLNPEDLLLPGEVTVPVKVDAEGVAVGPADSTGGRSRRTGIEAIEITRQFLGIAQLTNSRRGPQEQIAANTGGMLRLLQTLVTRSQVRRGVQNASDAVSGFSLGIF